MTYWAITATVPTARIATVPLLSYQATTTVCFPAAHLQVALPWPFFLTDSSLLVCPPASAFSRTPFVDLVVMSGFLRGKQAGMQSDLSASLRPELFMPDDQARYGINSQIRSVVVVLCRRPLHRAAGCCLEEV